MRSRPTNNRPSRSSKRTVRGAAAAASGPSGRLDDQLCFALYAAANAMQRAYAPLLRPLGLTYASYLVLLVLFEGDGLTVGEIGRRLFLDSGTLTPVLRRMEGLGIVTRRRSPDDEREVRISLTLAGQRLESKLDEIRAALTCRMALPVSALEALRGQLHDLRSRVAAEETGAA